MSKKWASVSTSRSLLEGCTWPGRGATLWWPRLCMAPLEVPRMCRSKSLYWPDRVSSGGGPGVPPLPKRNVPTDARWEHWGLPAGAAWWLPTLPLHSHWNLSMTLDVILFQGVQFLLLFLLSFFFWCTVSLVAEVSYTWKKPDKRNWR